jgi:3-dehydroshikimate dehydratase
MNYNICSISFRHTLTSINEIFSFSKSSIFYGIELWGVHARAIEYASFLNEPNSKITMISDYIDINQFQNIPSKCEELIDLAHKFKCEKIRIFAGNKSRDKLTPNEQTYCVKHLKFIANKFEDVGIKMVIETHPNTWADSLSSTLELIQIVDHKNLFINLDILHIWEAGDSPVEAYHCLKPWIVNFHFKNITHRDRLHVFEPQNVYSPSGEKGGMVSLENGAINYEEIIECLMKDDSDIPISLEWFGTQPYQQLNRDISWLKKTETKLTLSSGVLVNE